MEDNEIGLVIFDDGLSPKQIRNIERELQVKILDRTEPHPRYICHACPNCLCQDTGELAQYQYLLTFDPFMDSLRPSTREV